MEFVIIWIGLYFFNEIILLVKTESSIAEQLLNLDIHDSLEIWFVSIFIFILYFILSPILYIYILYHWIKEIK